jgi:3-oxoacyl-[acyl-carrier protein] reductase
MTTATQRIVFITGGASGIGRATVELLARAGDRVVAMDRDEAALSLLAQDMDARGLAVRCETVDVRDRVGLARVLDSEARVDVAIAVAGRYRSHPFDELSDQDFRETLDINLMGVFALAQEAARRMQAGGRIVVVSSRGALGMQRAADYVASKAGVVGLVRAMALDLRARQIAVNSVAPGFTDTPMTRSMPSDLYAAAALEPSGAAASPNDIAQAIAFFADANTRFITGQTLLVDGGKSLGGLGL